MRRSLVAVAALFLSAGVAQATDNILCAAADDAASITFLIGTTPGLNPLSLGMEAGGKKWSTEKLGGVTPIAVAQSFSTDASMMIDVADDNLENIFAELRVSKASEGGEHVFAGTLRIAGTGVWAVTCGSEN